MMAGGRGWRGRGRLGSGRSLKYRQIVEECLGGMRADGRTAEGGFTVAGGPLCEIRLL